MNIDYFINNLKFTFNKDILEDILKKMLTSNKEGNTTEFFKNLYKLYNINEEKTEINSDDYKYFLDEVIIRNYYYFYKNADMIANNITTSNNIKVSISQLNGNFENADKYLNSIYLNVSAEDTFNVLNSVFSTLKSEKIDSVIYIPSYELLDQGFKTQIEIKCKTEDLEHVLKALESLGEQYKDKIKEPNKLMGIMDKYGYDYNNIHELIGECLLRSIYESINIWSINSKSLKQDDIDKIDLLKESDKLNDLCEFINPMMNSDYINQLYKLFIKELEEEHLDINNVYMTSSLKDDLYDCYGNNNVDVINAEENNPKYTKYLFIIDNIDDLSKVVYDKDGNEILLVDFFEQNKLLEVLPIGCKIYLNEGECVNTKEYVNKYIVNYPFESFKGITLEEINDKYVSKIEKNKVRVR